jgi:hypothetical protein
LLVLISAIQAWQILQRCMLRGTRLRSINRFNPKLLLSTPADIPLLIRRSMTDSSTAAADLIAKLPPTVQNLVQNASSNLPGSTAFGSSENEWKEISDWLRLASGITSKADLEASSTVMYPNEFIDRLNRQSTDTKLVGKTYLAAPSPSAADIALFGALHPVVVSLMTPHDCFA